MSNLVVAGANFGTSSGSRTVAFSRPYLLPLRVAPDECNCRFVPQFLGPRRPRRFLGSPKVSARSCGPGTIRIGECKIAAADRPKMPIEIDLAKPNRRRFLGFQVPMAIARALGSYSVRSTE